MLQRNTQDQKDANLEKINGALNNTSSWTRSGRLVGLDPGPDGMITFALADRKKTAFVKPWDEWMTFKDFAEVFGANPIVSAEKESVPLVVFAWVNGDERRWVGTGGRKWETGGAQRMLFNCKGVTCIGLDFDSGDTTLEGIAAALQKHGLEGFVHSTHSHTPEKPKHRCVVPLTRPFYVPHDVRDARLAFKDRYHALAERLGAGTQDRACSDPMRMFYLPSHKPDAVYEWCYVEGEPLEFETLPVVARAPLSKRASIREAPHTSVCSLAADDGALLPTACLKQIEQALAVVPACVEYPTWRDVVWAVHSSTFGTSDESAARLIVEEWSKTCPEKFDQRAFDELWAGADAEGGITIQSLWHIARPYGYGVSRQIRVVGKTAKSFKR